MNTIAKLTITRSGYLIELTELGKHLSPGTYELTQVPAQADRQRVPQGWRFVRRADGIGIYAPTPNPGENARTGHTVPLEDRDLYDLLGKLADQQAAMLAAAPEAPAPHPDDVAVDDFAQAMKAKLAKAREKGRSGWETFPPEELSRMLREHVEKGDPRDVANFCMFLWWLGHGIAPAQASAVDEREAFEEWVLREYATVRREHGGLLWDDPSAGAAVGHAWSGWQARAALAQQAKLDELALLCAEAYQVVGSLLYDVGAFDDAHAQRVFNSTHAQKILDNLSQARRVHTDVLPWPTFTKPKD